MADNRPAELAGQMPSSFDDTQVFPPLSPWQLLTLTNAPPSEHYNEKPIRRIARRIKEEPLVPLGIGLTVFAFTNAYRALRRGDSHQANRMFRARIAAQGFTVIAMVAGSMYYQKDREKNKELQKLQEQKNAEEKRQKWIRELEVRDQEDKMLKEKLHKKVLAAAAAAASLGEGEEAGKAEKAEEDKGDAAAGQGGGSMSSMGLWNRGQKVAEEQQGLEEGSEKKAKKENPKSSLGAIGEAMKKKDE